MPGKSNVRVTPHTQEATDFIASLCSPAKRRMTPAHSQLKRIKTDPDAVSSSQAMQDSTAHSNASQPASFAEQQPRKQAMASNTSQQSSNPSMAELGLTGMDDDFSPGSDEHIPPNKRQRTNIPARTNSQRRREAAAEIQPRFNLVISLISYHKAETTDLKDCSS